MKKTILFFAFAQIFFLQAQYESAVFDYEMAYFNNGQALPAEAMLIFSGDIAEDIDAIEIAVYKPNGKKPLYEGLWQRTDGNTGESFRLPVNYRLQGGSEYDFKFSYFKELKMAEKSSIQADVVQKIKFYREQQVKMEKGKLQLKKSASKLLSDFNTILADGLKEYRPARTHMEIQFSSMLEEYLKVLEKDSMISGAQQLDELLVQEVKQLLEREWWRLDNVREVQDYPTEKMANALALNVGYGGVLLSGKADNFTYGSAPYIGLSIPLSNRAYSSPVLKNTSVSLGAFTKNFEGNQGETITGPVFGRPYFVGLGYSIFRFVRFNAGVVALEEKQAGDQPSFQLDRIQVQPFVGLSAEIKFSVGLNN